MSAQKEYFDGGEDLLGEVDLLCGLERKKKMKTEMVKKEEDKIGRRRK